MPQEKPQSPPDRRGFVKQALAAILTGVAALVPVGAGIVVAADPLRRQAAAENEVRITPFDALPADGAPRRFPVVATRTDAWNRSDAVPIGAVYLRRTGDNRVEALNVVCPHAGCAVEFERDAGQFRCPCHRSSFKVDGAIADPHSPASRGMDSLEARVDGDGVVWVKFQNFEAGRPDKVPVA